MHEVMLTCFVYNTQSRMYMEMVMNSVKESVDGSVMEAK